MRQLYYSQNTRILFLLLATVWLSGCAASKTTYSPIGRWNYTVVDTPYGDVSGVITIDQYNGQYTGSLESSLGSSSLKNLAIQGNELSTVMDLQGMELGMKGTFKGDTFSGQVAAGYDRYPIRASRNR